MVPKPPKSPKDMETHNNLLLIRVMKEMGRDVWYAPRYGPLNESEHTLWKAISCKTRLRGELDGLQANLTDVCSIIITSTPSVIYMQAQWPYLRDLYVRDRNNALSNSSCAQTEFLRKYGEHLKFLEDNVDCWSKLLYDHENDKQDSGRNDSMPGPSDKCETIAQKNAKESPLPTINDEKSNIDKDSSSETDKNGFCSEGERRKS